MFQGWLSFAGNELLNEERFRAYQKELVPQIKMPTICSDEKELAVMLNDEPYRTPLLDEAPWVDHDDPDTYGFVGAFPLSVSGLTDSTRTASVVENSIDGGAIVGRRRRAKEVRVTALLMGDTEAALAAGKRWLAAVLDGGCDPCEPSDLCFLVGTNPDGVTLGDYTTYLIPPSSIYGPAATWGGGTGVFTPASSGESLISPPSHVPLPCDEIFWHWRITSATAGTQIVLETVSETGVTVSMPYTLSSTGGTFTVTDRGIAQKSSYSRLRVISAPGETIVVGDVTMEYRNEATEDACFTKYARQLRRVSCISGPTTIEEFQPSQGAMETVEFSFAAEMPYVFGLEKPVLTLFGGEVTTYYAADYSTTVSAVVPSVRLAQTVPMCTTSNRPPLVADPDCPVIPLPPRSSVSVTACAPDPAYYSSFALPIPDSLIPQWSEAAPIFKVGTGPNAARKVQVRFLPRPLPTQQASDLDPCSACGTFVIDYIPPNSTFVVDAADQRAYIIQSGNRYTNAGHLLSGPTSTTLFQWPILTCGTGYFAIVDTTTGVNRFDLSLTVRE
jgi:hypothetical protein